MLILGICLLAVGFAAVATTLIINGNVTVGTNTDDFRVIFTDTTVPNGSTATIVNGGKKINFETKVLDRVGESVTLDYEITNFSKNYDVTTSVTLKNYTENNFYEITKQ